MHRLGRGTSGLVVFGRTKAARSGLARSWRDGRVRRIYRGLVEGAPPKSTFTIETPIGLVEHAVLGSVYGASQRIADMKRRFAACSFYIATFFLHSDALSDVGASGALWTALWTGRMKGLAGR